MKPSAALLACLALSRQAISTPIASGSDLIERDPQPESTWTDTLSLRDLVDREPSSQNTLEKRRGGGGSGGGGGRGGSSGGSSSGGSSSGGSRGGSSGGSTGGTTGGGRTTSSSSGARPAYGGGAAGGAVYGGGSTTAYKPGTKSPIAGITPFLLVGGVGLGALALAWPHGAYTYGWNHPYTYRNNTNGQNETLPVKCLCDPDSACGCDEPNNSTYLNSLLPNGTSTNTSVATIQTVNSTRQVILNGTLPNGTDDSATTSGALAGLPDSRRVALDALVAAGVVVGALWI